MEHQHALIQHAPVLILSTMFSKILCGCVICTVPSAPVDFVNVSRTATSLSFSWKAPTDVNGILQDYKVLIFPITILV